MWLNLEQMTELFKRDKSVISRHISNIFKEKELEKNSTVANFATVQNESSGTQFRIWANKLIREYLVKGYNLNVNRFKNARKTSIIKIYL